VTVRDADPVTAIARAVGIRRTRAAPLVTWFESNLAPLDSDDCAIALACVVYRWAYCIGAPRPRRELAWTAGAIEGPRPTSRLSGDRLQAWDRGWTVEASEDGLMRAAKPGEPSVLLDRSWMRPPDATTGEVVDVRVPAASANRLPGWFTLSSGSAPALARAVRFYLNTPATAAQSLSERLASRFLDFGIPDFTVKWLLGQDHDERCDSTVVYVAAEAAEEAAGVIVRSIDRSALHAGVPMFTRRLIGGLGMAESPPGGESFGEMRSHQVATALVRALRSGKPDRPWAEIVVDFNRKRPWKLAADTGELNFDLPRRRRGPTEGPAAGESCVALADRLCREALRSDGRAAWVQRDPLPPFGLRTTGAQVYDGAPGPVLLLAHATRIIGSQSYRATMRAAASDVAQRASSLASNGFHNGAAGTAATLAEAARVAADERVLELGAQVRLVALDAWHRHAPEWDVTQGIAGFILGVVAASELLEEPVPSEIEAAMRELSGRAQWTGRTATWRSPVGEHRRVALAGLAHGASGAALALSVGDRSMGSTTHRPAIEAALRFEDSRRRSPTGGWCDHRQTVPGPDPVGWCHGAAGIAVASAAMAGNVGELGLLERAAEAGTVVAGNLERIDGDACLCHGTAGAALALHHLSHLVDIPLWTSQAAASLDSRGPVSPRDHLSLMTGEVGRALARLAIHDGAPSPLAFVLDVPLWRRGRGSACGSL